MLKWANGSKAKPRVGMKVKRGNAVSTIEVLYLDIPGGVILCPEVEGFRSWNIDALVPFKMRGSNDSSS